MKIKNKLLTIYSKLGNKDLWKEIYKANKKDISNPNLIYPNQVILIPTKITKPKDKTKK